MTDKIEELRLISQAFRVGFMAATHYNWERAEGLEDDYCENALTEWLTQRATAIRNLKSQDEPR